VVLNSFLSMTDLIICSFQAYLWSTDSDNYKSVLRILSRDIQTPAQPRLEDVSRRRFICETWQCHLEQNESRVEVDHAGTTSWHVRLCL